MLFGPKASSPPHFVGSGFNYLAKYKERESVDIFRSQELDKKKKKSHLEAVGHLLLCVTVDTVMGQGRICTWRTGEGANWYLTSQKEDSG